MIKLANKMAKPSVPFTTKIIPKINTIMPIPAVIIQLFFHRNKPT